MNVFLLYPTQNFILQKEFSLHEETIFKDLDLETICQTMADNDPILFATAKTALLTTVPSIETIHYRQDIFKDCLKNTDILQKLYALTKEGIAGKPDQHYRFFVKAPSSVLSYAVNTLEFYVTILRRLRKIADEATPKFSSNGFLQFFSRLEEELTDCYFSEISEHLQSLSFRDGILVSASLGEGNKGMNYTLRKQKKSNKNWLQKLFSKKRTNYTFHLAERDDSGARALSELRDICLNHTANTLAQSMDHILAFFNTLQIELGYYIGSLNLYNHLMQKKIPTTFPIPVSYTDAIPAQKLSFLKLYDTSLALLSNFKIQSNDLHADGKEFIFITGANQGGKSVFLRSLGVAQLMMQCGLFVCADFFSATICSKVFTHYRKEEDRSMNSGKLDEELVRMDRIVKEISPYSLVLFNESFAATNERDGSEIARQISEAFLENHIKIYFVTHLYEFPSYFFTKRTDNLLFLQAERRNDGSRSFQFSKSEPSTTSFGQDLYKKVFL